MWCEDYYKMFSPEPQKGQHQFKDHKRNGHEHITYIDLIAEEPVERKLLKSDNTTIRN